MPIPKMTDAMRRKRAIDNAEQLAHDLRVLGHAPQAELIDEIAAGLYSTSFNLAIRAIATTVTR